MRTLALAAIAALSLVLPAEAKSSTTPVQFDSGQNSAMLRGSVRGYDSANFTITVQQGQTLAIELKPNNPSCYFNLYAPGDRPGQSTAIHDGSVSGLAYAQPANESGEFVAEVYLMRNEARNNATCNFEIYVTLIGGTAQSSSNQDQAAIDSCEEATLDTLRTDEPSASRVRLNDDTEVDRLSKRELEVTGSGSYRLSGRSENFDWTCVYNERNQQAGRVNIEY